jgi:hypothetical protein
MHASEAYIAVQQRVPQACVLGRVFKEHVMSNSLSNTLVQAPTSGERVNHIVTEAFQAATIVLAGVLGILTVAATI